VEGRSGNAWARPTYKALPPPRDLAPGRVCKVVPWPQGTHISICSEIPPGALFQTEHTPHVIPHPNSGVNRLREPKAEKGETLSRGASPACPPCCLGSLRRQEGGWVGGARDRTMARRVACRGFLVIRLSSHLPGNLRKRSGSQTHIISFVRGAKFEGMNWLSVLPAMHWQDANLSLLIALSSVADMLGRGRGSPISAGLAS
jgi:hypothetical protein